MTRSTHPTRVRSWLLLIGTLIAWNLWALSRLSGAANRLDRTTLDLAHCQALAADIQQLSTRPKQVAEGELQSEELASRIERAASVAAVPPEQLISVSPQASRRVAESEYLEKPTALQLRAVTLRQLVAMLVELCGDGSALEVSSIRLSAPREQENGDQWNADVTLCYWIYAPRQPVRRSQP